MSKRSTVRLTLSALLSVSVALPGYAEDTDIRFWTAPPYWADSSRAHGRHANDRQTLAASPTALPFIALTPCRLVDTRGNGAPLQGGFLPAATVRTYTLTGVCGVPANAQAISLNATAVKPTGPGFLVLYPEGGTFPPVSTLNFLGNDVIVNAAVVPLSATGGISVALGVNGGDVLLDTNGYYAVSDVASLSGLVGDVTLAAGSNITITPSGNTLTIDSTGGGGGAPSGPAGGGLAGTYPNPTLAASSVGTPQIAAGAVTDAKVASGLSYGKLTGAPASLPPSGAAGGGLAGTYPNPSLAANSVGASQIVSGAVGSTQLAAGSVTDAKVANGISYSKLSGAPASLPPSGAAGGALSGSYPNPGLGSGVVVKTLNGLTDGVTLAAGSNITITPAGNTLTLASSAAGLTLPYSGSVSSAAAALAVTNSGTGPGVYGSSTRDGVAGQSSGGGNSGVYGLNTGGGTGVWGASTGDGVVGQSSAPDKSGVFGYNTGSGYGVAGHTSSSTGAGVSGDNYATGPGVIGTSTLGSGVIGKSNAPVPGSQGIWGDGGLVGFGILGTSDSNIGVYGKSNSWSGVSGLSTEGSGVDGYSTNGHGVSGTANNGGAGLYGRSLAKGPGVWGIGFVAGKFEGTVLVTTLAGAGNRAVYSDAAGNLTNASSDARLKKDVVDLPAEVDVLGALSRLRGVAFNWDTEVERAKSLGAQREIGVIAQEVEAILPQVVGTHADGYKSVDYAKLTAFLIEVAKVQQTQVRALHVDLREQGKEIERLRQQVGRQDRR